jgi:hypothetical protein
MQETYKQQIGVNAWPEEQLKPLVSDLTKHVAAAVGTFGKVRTFGEIPVESDEGEAIGRPDIGVATDGLLSGYIELKKPGSGADPDEYAGRDADQWNRFRDLPNLLYTDGKDFAHFRFGEQVGETVRLSGDPTEGGAGAVSDLKPLGLSPAEALVKRTVYFLPADVFFPILGWWEVAIGAALLFRPLVRLALFLLFAQMVGTFLPLVVLPEVVWTNFPFALTTEGQYIIKNLVLIGAALVVGGTVREESTPRRQL